MSNGKKNLKKMKLLDYNIFTHSQGVHSKTLLRSA